MNVIGLDTRDEPEELDLEDLSDEPPADWTPEEVEEFETDMDYLFTEGFVFQGEDGGLYAHE